MRIGLNLANDVAPARPQDVLKLAQCRVFVGYFSERRNEVGTVEYRIGIG
jgi:hypothetical protein